MIVMDNVLNVICVTVPKEKDTSEEGCNHDINNKIRKVCNCIQSMKQKTPKEQDQEKYEANGKSRNIL